MPDEADREALSVLQDLLRRSPAERRELAATLIRALDARDPDWVLQQVAETVTAALENHEDAV